MKETATEPMNATFRAVLFDFDGTLGDSYPAIAASVNHLRARRGLPPLPADEVRRFVGRGPAHLLGHTLPGADVEPAMAAYRAHHVTVMRELTQLLPGAAEALTALHRAGLRLGVCSNKPVDFTRALLDHLGVASVFEIVLGPQDVPRPKPAPDMLLAALRRLDLPAAQVLYLGDMTVDIATARAAGVTVWVVPTGSEDRDDLLRAGPDRLLESLAELPALLT